jgi:R3H domain
MDPPVEHQLFVEGNTNEVAMNAPSASQSAPPRRRRPRTKKPTNVEGATSSNENINLAPSNKSKKNGKQKAPGAANALSPANVPAAKPPVSEAEKVAPKKSRKKKKKRDLARHPWKNQLPVDAVDPITLEPLDQLTYPPFALVATEPYEPIDWPLSSTANTIPDNEGEEERQRRILQEQWGSLAAGVQSNDDEEKEEDAVKTPRHLNLFDGQVLAYYMVSQSQFIDPLNRRDLSRDELLHLDRYLRKHGIASLNVTEAYDTKGIALSTAGASATTAAGRSLMLEQEARLLLNSLFGGRRSHHPEQARPSNHPPNSMQQQYEAHEAAQRRAQPSTVRSNVPTEDNHDLGDAGGFMIIDDDEFPGLRGSHTAGTAHTPVRYSQPPVAARVPDFPSLAATVPTEMSAAAAAPPTAKKPAPKTKTLSKIGKLVQETDPEEQQRQWEARELARRKAMVANLTFGADLPSMSDAIPSHITALGPSEKLGPTEAQLERNRTLAEALGVQPATVRAKMVPGGWRRPTERSVERDEFGNELNATTYPDSLIRQGKELRLDIILKLEKKWKAFLGDDTAASLPLYPMERSVRAFVHEYAEYWKLHTESFDPEPKRYIHCVKLRDTSAPYPLLSDAMRNWQPNRLVTFDHSTQQTAGQSTMSEREFPSGPARVPLSLKPRSTLASEALGSTTAALMGVSISGVPSRTMDDSDIVNSRFSALYAGRERPKLELQPRTLPLEQPAVSTTVASTQPKVRVVDRSDQAAKQEQRQRRALEAAFASDDEPDSDSEWEEKVPVFAGSDEE